MLFTGLINTPFRVAQIPEILEDDSPLSISGPEKMDIDGYRDKIKGIVLMDVEEGVVEPHEALQGLSYALNHIRFELSNEVRRV